jgi:sulfatase maturation enzyme AslB (radical SAM superfamily)
MKIDKILIFLVIFLSSTSSVLAWQIDPIFSIFQKGNFSSLSNQLSQEVDLTIMDNQNFESPIKAIEKLKNFFNKNTISTIEPIHNGSSKSNNNNFSVCKIMTKSNMQYRMMIYQEIVKGKKLISEIRIEKFDE